MCNKNRLERRGTAQWKLGLWRKHSLYTTENNFVISVAARAQVRPTYPPPLLCCGKQSSEPCSISSRDPKWKTCPTNYNEQVPRQQRNKYVQHRPHPDGHLCMCCVKLYVNVKYTDTKCHYVARSTSVVRDGPGPTLDIAAPVVLHEKVRTLCERRTWRNLPHRLSKPFAECLITKTHIQAWLAVEWSSH